LSLCAPLTAPRLERAFLFWPVDPGTGIGAGTGTGIGRTRTGAGRAGAGAGEGAERGATSLAYQYMVSLRAFVCFNARSWFYIRGV